MPEPSSPKPVVPSASGTVNGFTDFVSRHMKVRRRRKAALLPEPMWIRNVRTSRAAALAVPADARYSESVHDKLVELLETAGNKAAKAPVQAYLERDELEILALDFPLGCGRRDSGSA